MNIPEDKIIEDNNESLALACLLVADVVYLNDGHPWFTDKIYTTCVFVNCNDVFAWGCSDAECIKCNDNEPGSEIIHLYTLWKENPKWGAIKWVALKRNLQPQPPIKRDMIASEYWDSDLEALDKNPADR